MFMQFVAPHSRPRKEIGWKKRKKYIYHKGTQSDPHRDHNFQMRFVKNLLPAQKKKGKNNCGVFPNGVTTFLFQAMLEWSLAAVPITESQFESAFETETKYESPFPIPMAVPYPPPAHSNTFWTAGPKGSSGACSESHAKGNEIEGGGGWPKHQVLQP